jgi:hypothetical protein
MKAIKKWYGSLSRLNKLSTWLALVTVSLFTLTATLATFVDASTEAAREAADVSTIELLTAALTDELGAETNRDLPRDVEVSLMDGDLYVSFALDESFSSDATIRGAWQETATVVKLVQRSGLSKNLTISGFLELVDNNGNSLGENVVFTANFLDDKVPLLNTENLDGRDMWESAASSFIYHPAIKD